MREAGSGKNERSDPDHRHRAVMAEEAGFTVEEAIPNPYHDEHWRRLYAVWLAHADELHAELGEQAAGNLLAEARDGQTRQWDGLPPSLLLVLRRPNQPEI